jgi:putative DNA primase/helicase
LTGLLGTAGLGKTTYTLGLAAQVTRGLLPGLDGPANVLVSSAEDDLPAVLTPRLVAAGADLQRVRFLEDLTVPDDVPALERLGRDFGAALVVVDPISAHYAANVKSHEEASIRRALKTLAQLAQSLDAAVLAVVHPNKAAGQAALSRISGSGGFGNAVRSVIVFGRDPGDPEGERGVRRIIASEKLNVGAKPASIAAEIQAVEVEIDGAIASVPRLEVTGASEVKADELLAWQSPDEKSDREAAREWLLESLADGPVKAAELLTRATKEGHTERTLRRAKKDLDLASEKTPEGWLWKMPEGDDAE